MTRLEVQMSSLITTVATQVASDGRHRDSQQAILTRLERALEDERLARQGIMSAERESRQQAITIEREARLALGADFRVFTTKILVGLGIVVFIAQLGITLIGPEIRHLAGLP